MERRVFSGIQPTGDIHLGNYIGAIRRWAAEQNDGFNIFCIVDLHSITIPQDPGILKEKTLQLAALLLAAGIDPQKCLLFIQSHNPDHANLAWIMNCFSSMGQLSRMTQYKEKAQDKDFVSVGLFDYPVLMAADILLYDTTEVPVGEDQTQHVEFTRDIAERFNSRLGKTFILPEAKISGIGSRLMNLIDPTKKMSKSDPNPNTKINILDDEKTVFNKIRSATTDSGSEVKYDTENKPGISNLMEIYSVLSGENTDQVTERFKNKKYGEFKEAVAVMINSHLAPLQKNYHEWREKSSLKDILNDGAAKARAISSKKLSEVYEKMGFLR